MAGSYFKQACPSCEALVPIPDKSYIGKKIPCPNCKYRFVVEDPAARDKAATKGSTAAKEGKSAGKKAAVEERTPAEVEEDLEESQETAKKGQKKAAKAGRSLLENKKMLAGLGLAVVGVIGLAVAAFFLFRPNQGPAVRGSTGVSLGVGNWQADTSQTTSGKTGEKKEEAGTTSPPTAELLPAATPALTNLLPPGTERVSRLHFQNLLDSPAGQALLRALPAEALRKELGFNLKAVDEVLRAESFTNKWAFNVIHVREALDEKALTAALGLKPAAGSPINTHSFYQATRKLPWLQAFAHLSLAPRGGQLLDEKVAAQPLLVYLHDRQTLITGDAAPVMEFLRANGQFPQQVVTSKPAPPSSPPAGPPGAPPGPFFPPGMKPSQSPAPPGAPAGPAPTPSGPPAGPPPGAPAPQPGQPPVPPGAPGAAPGQPPLPPGAPGSSPPASVQSGGPPTAPGTPPGSSVPPGAPSGAPPFGPPAGQTPPPAASTATSLTAYLTIKPVLKAMLDHLEIAAGSGKILFSSAIDLTAVRALPNDHWARLRQLWDVTLTLEQNQGERLHVLGLAIVQRKPKWFQFLNGLEAERDEDVRVLQNQLLGQTAPEVVRFFQDVFGHKVEINAGGSEEHMAQGGTGAPPGFFPPGAFPPGSAPPGSFPPGSIPPGVAPPGVAPPGVSPGEGPPPGFQPPFPPQGGSQPPGTEPPTGGPPPGFQPPGFPPGFQPPGGSFPPGFQPPGYPGNPPAQKPPAAETEPKQSQLSVRRQGKNVFFLLDLVLGSDDQEKLELALQVMAASFKNQLEVAAAQDRRSILGQAVRQLGEQGVPDKVKAGYFPPATLSPAASSTLRLPEHRLSWMTGLLPYLGQEPLFRALHWDRPWDHPSNWLVGRALVPEFLDPAYPENSRRVSYPGVPLDLGATHYVGIAGVGLEAADYPDEPAYKGKLGIFGYERSLALQRVAAGHGLSNTILLLEVPPDGPAGLTPWIAGGGSTVRGVPEKNSIQPFVANHGGQRGTFAVMADGSVRFLSAEIADDIFQRMCQVDLPPLPNFDINQVAPLLSPNPAAAPSQPAASPGAAAAPPRK
jgi:hypothetical protein